jgi:hypothetical protein
MYLIFNTEQEALVVADQEGQHRNFPYWNPNDIGKTRTLNSPIITANNKYALDVSNYLSLTTTQQEATVSTVTLPTSLDSQI